MNDNSSSMKRAYLSKHGYVLRKDQFKDDELFDLKKTLRARPLVDTKFLSKTNEQVDTSFPVYIETKNKLYIPKMYGIEKFGLPESQLDNYNGKTLDSNSITFNGSLFDRQKEPVDILIQACREKGGGILSMATGQGKCHGLNTPILMFDGSIKMVQDICEGELLMGDDNTPRKVLTLARGKDVMYDIISVKGEKYTVNQEHILCLKNTRKKPWVETRIQNKIKRYDVQWWENNKKKSKVCDTIDEANKLVETKINKHQDIVEISVKDYIKQSKTFKHHFKGYRVAIDFDKKEIPIDPYMIGFWLGDGTSRGSQITTQDSTVLHYFVHNLSKYNLSLKKRKDLYGYGISGYSGKLNSNLFLTTLKELNLLINKHIPYIYKCNSREIRLKLLAGLLDSDGCLGHDKCTFDFSQKSEKLIDDVIYLCRSLGFACYKSKQIKGCWYKGEYKKDYYYRISISGQTDEIPTLCPRKKANHRKQIKDVLMTGIRIKEVGYDKYYGFEIDGNRRYMMGDFTVTHNTISSLYVLSQLKSKTIIVVNKIPLMKQWQSEIAKFLPNAKVGIIQGQKNIDVEDKDIVIAMLQSLSRIDYPDELFKDFRVTLVDEVHNLGSQMFSKILFKLCSKYTIGLSATPTRADGCEYVFKWHLGDIVFKRDAIREGKAPIVRHLKIDSEDYKEICTINKFTGQKSIQFTSMLSELVEMEKRNKLVIEIIKDCRKYKRKILVLSDRRNHLQSLYKLLEKDINISFTYGLFLGSMKIAELEKSKACDVILATYAAFGEGVSEKDLDTLLLITPKKFIGHLKNATKNESGKLEQIIGRIFRKKHVDNHPLIVDFQDNFSVYKTQSAGRRKFYKEHFENVKFINQSINLDDYDLNSIHFSCIKTKNSYDNDNDNTQCTQLPQNCLID